MCETALKRVKQQCEEKPDDQYYVSTSIITRKSFLRHIKGYRQHAKAAEWPPPLFNWGPRANLYYPFNEDTNPFTRASELAKSACSCQVYDEIRPHFDPPLDPFIERDPYSEEDARVKYLKTPPTCFVIFGKPDMNGRKLAKMIADSWKCVLVSPDVLLKEEIEKKSKKGRWIGQVLRDGRSIGSEVIMNLVQSRINEIDVLHRGYVVEGLPLIPNDSNLDYSSYRRESDIYIPKYESKQNIGVTFQAQGKPSIRSRRRDHFMGEEKEEGNDEDEESEEERTSSIEEAPSSSISEVYELTSNPFASETDNPILRDDFESDIAKQIDEIFEIWPIKPQIIIYAMCPDQDVFRRRDHVRWDPHSGNTIDLLRRSDELFTLFSRNQDNPDAEISLDLYQEIASEQKLADVDFRKHLLKRVSDMRANVEVQCNTYERYALPCIEKRVLLHNPQHVIRVDTRTSATQMFQIVGVRLRTLPLPRVILPLKMSEEVEEIEGGEETAETVIEEFQGKTPEEAFEELSERGVVSHRFRWRLSQWQYHCPVALARGRTVEGRADFAVRFTSEIFFLSSQEAMETFLLNPRPFLLPPNPRPSCKVAIFGPKYCGKSQLSNELADALGGIVIDVQALEKTLIEERIEANVAAAVLEIVEDVILELGKRLMKEWEEREASRVAALEAWYQEVRPVAIRLIDIIAEKYEQGEAFPANPEELEKVRKELQVHELGFLESNENSRKRIERDNEVLREFAPDHLRLKEPPVRQLTAHDPEVATILDERVKYLYDEPIEISKKDRAEMLIRNIAMIPDIPGDFGIVREGGWVLDDMYADPEVWRMIAKAGIVPYDVIVIREKNPYKKLIEKWRRHNIIGEGTEYKEGDENNIAQEDQEEDGGVLKIRSKETEESYILDIKRFEVDWQTFQETLFENEQEAIDCDLSTDEDLLKKVLKHIKDRYRHPAILMTDEERDKEAENIVTEGSTAREGTVAEEEEEEDKRTKNSRGDEMENHDNRRLGDTGPYCPLALRRYGVLWKGKDEFSAIFQNKIYLLSSEEALYDFISDPYKVLPLKSPLEVIPPFRLSIVGPPGSGKTTVSAKISKECGLAQVDFFIRLDKYMKMRGFPSIGSKHEIFAGLAEEEVEIELPEDPEDQRYDIDKVTIRSFIRKYLKEGGTLPKKMLKECHLNFFRAPYDEGGVIFDGFPTCPEDVTAALENFAVPEIILELRCSLEKVQERLVPKLFQAWKEKQEIIKVKEEERYIIELETFENNKKKWIEKKARQRRRERRANLSIAEKEMEEFEEADEMEDGEFPFSDPPRASDTAVIQTVPAPALVVSKDSVDSKLIDPNENQAAVDLIELEQAWYEEFAEPVKFDDWEDPQDARERISREVEEFYEEASQNLASARTVLEDDSSIPWIEVDAEVDVSLVFFKILRLLDPYIFRNSSALERTYPIDLETAERLLDCGYYFLSSFGRYCPVQLYEKKNPFQMFLSMEAQQQVYPVLHRQYVYFLTGKEYLEKFTKHPLKYLDQDSCSPLIPARVSIIGPPKCGKSTLAERFARTYGMKVITRGQALRHTLKNFSWSELARLTDAHLRGGHVAMEESIARAVELFSIDPRSSSQGYVLDGFPANQAEAEELAFLAIQPMIILDLKADLDFCLECLATEAEQIKKPPSFSSSYLTHQYLEWCKDAQQFRYWLKRFSQNVFDVDATTRKWCVWTRADEEVRRRFSRIKKYFREAAYDKVHRLSYLCVSPYEFREKQSHFESFCPVCFTRDGSMNFSGAPPDQHGMVQYREYFYWVCPSHLELFCEKPLEYLPPLNNARLPEDRPRIIEESFDVEHACWAKRLRVGGFCLVTYVENLPKRKLIRGENNLAVMYLDKLYLFCSEECRREFMRRTSRYSTVEIHFQQCLQPIEIKTLPNLGFLEQTVATLIVRAVNSVGVLRPKLPGMSASIAAAVYVGAYLKVHHVSCDLKEVAIYEEVMRRIEGRCQIVDVATRSFKRKINPQVTVPPRNARKSSLEAMERKTGRTKGAKNNSVIKFRRTSPTQIFDRGESRRTTTAHEGFLI